MKIHESKIGVDSLNEEEQGSFTVDQHIGKKTKFQIYTMVSNADNGLIKSVVVKDNRGNSYSKLIDRQQFHLFSVYQVPFSSVSI